VLYGDNWAPNGALTVEKVSLEKLSHRQRYSLGKVPRSEVCISVCVKDARPVVFFRNWPSWGLKSHHTTFSLKPSFWWRKACPKVRGFFACKTKDSEKMLYDGNDPMNILFHAQKDPSKSVSHRPRYRARKKMVSISGQKKNLKKKVKKGTSRKQSEIA